jgi:TolB-like protein/Tfp pilus assembly protein PilF
VNIAARLESIADSGGIYISGSVARAIRNHDEIDYIPVGTATLKNVSYPVDIYAIQGPGFPIPSKHKIEELSSSHIGTRKKSRRFVLFIIILIIAAGGWLTREFLITPADDRISSMAVLPLSNLTGDPDQEYFVAGMHDALITELSKIGSLRIISRQSTLQYQESTFSMKEIAKQLGVDAIVEGSVFKSGNQVRIQIQLIRAMPEESHILAQSYDRELSDVLNMHREITQDIATRVQVHLTAGERALLQDTKKVNPEAYEAYLKGQFHWNKLTRDDLNMAENYYKLALEKDPEYALAYVGLSSIGVGRAQMGYAPWKESALKSMGYMDKAIELDSTLSEVHFMNAAFNSWGLWNWKKAEQEYKKALDQNPNYAIARAYYSQHLCVMKRTEEGLRQNVLAIELDPFNTLYKELYGMDLLFAKKYQEAQQLLENILENEPESRIALTTLRSVYHQQKKYDKAIEIWERTYPGDQEAVKTLEEGYLEGGYSMALRRLAEMLIVRSSTSFVTPWQIGTIYTRAGMKDEALEWLEKAYEAHDPNMPYINIDPIFDYMRNEPTFIELVDRMDFPD